VIGTTEGMLEIFNLSSAACVASVKAHDGAIWAIAITPDMQVKFFARTLCIFAEQVFPVSC